MYTNIKRQSFVSSCEWDLDGDGGSEKPKQAEEHSHCVPWDSTRDKREL